MSGRLAVSLMRPDQHEIRPPGEDDWLTVERVDRFPIGVRLRAGGREFLTDRFVKWPARVVAS